MATVKYILQSKLPKEQNVYLRLSLSAKKSLKRKAGFTAKRDNWNDKKGEPRNTSPELKNLKTQLEKLQTYVGDCLNKAIAEKKEISGQWLQDTINEYHGIKEVNSDQYLANYAQVYTDRLPQKVRTDGTVGVSASTIEKSTIVRRRILEFEGHTKKRYLISDVNTKFASDFVAFLRHEKDFGTNTIGMYLRHLKAWCNDARRNGYEVSYQVENIKSFREETIKIFLNQDEIDLLQTAIMPQNYLDNARNWLVLGCNIGQRGGDLLNLTSKNLTISGGVKLAQLVQQKTKKRVAVPINDQAQEILNKNGGEFPARISNQSFNKYIKEVCKLAGLTKKIEGSKVNPATLRKEKGIYHKWELVTSHICRRSFATNYYGIIPTAYLKDITAHSTEKQFLAYVGKGANESAQQVAQYMADLSRARKSKNGFMKVV